MVTRPEPTSIEFDATRPAALIKAIEDLLVTRDGWVNIQAIVDEDLREGPRGTAGIFGLFTAKGPEVPACTWVPGELDRNHGIRSDEVGIQHAGGPRALTKLRQEGTPPPDGWKQMADHPKRGLVLQSTHPTTAADVAPMVTWLILASRLLTENGLPDTWGAVVHHR
jgi:hypothetical protein